MTLLNQYFFVIKNKQHNQCNLTSKWKSKCIKVFILSVSKTCRAISVVQLPNKWLLCPGSFKQIKNMQHNMSSPTPKRMNLLNQCFFVIKNKQHNQCNLTPNDSYVSVFFSESKICSATSLVQLPKEWVFWINSFLSSKTNSVTSVIWLPYKWLLCSDPF